MKYRLLYVSAICLLSGCATIASQYKETEQQNTVGGYEAFIREHPDAAQTAAAREKIEQLRKQPAASLFFKEVCAANNVDQYEQFLQRFPDDRNANEVKARIERLKYASAVQAGTSIAYKDFLAQCSAGPDSDRLRAALPALEKAEEARHSASARDARSLLAAMQEADNYNREIHTAARNGELEKVKALLRKDPTLVSSKDENGETPLHLAAPRGGPTLECAEEMRSLQVDSGGQVIALDGTVTKLSIGTTDIELEQKALGVEDGYAIVFTKKCGKLRVKMDSTGGGTVVATPVQRAELEKLYEAGGHPYKDVMKLLLDSKADVNAKDNDGATPLHCAARAGQKDAAELLLANKADANAKDNDNTTPLALALKSGERELIELLRKNGAHE